ncbi:MAG: hypothetical protein U0703_13090 [Anaerolineae bacterium]
MPVGARPLPGVQRVEVDTVAVEAEIAQRVHHQRAIDVAAEANGSAARAVDLQHVATWRDVTGEIDQWT